MNVPLSLDEELLLSGTFKWHKAEDLLLFQDQSSFYFLAPAGSSQPAMESSLRDLASRDILSRWYTDIHAGKAPIHIK